ncbi:hypothetical protein [Bacillus sp. FJAT-27445]|uniref:hypothetical protein n=1 Tax=Bacillus sp. FJAT-27445 TaxID=1679166 RepID=UPI00074400F0|nr:hypothetical protein [Bacillus sp. FJAT-27445]
MNRKERFLSYILENEVHELELSFGNNTGIIQLGMLTDYEKLALKEEGLPCLNDFDFYRILDSNSIEEQDIRNLQKILNHNHLSYQWNYGETFIFNHPVKEVW